MHTVRYDGAAIDLGAMVVTGVPGNPVAALAKQTRSHMHGINSRCRIYSSDGTPVAEALDTHMEGEWNSLLDSCKMQSRPEPAPDASVGQLIRKLIRTRRESYTDLEVEISKKEAAKAEEHEHKVRLLHSEPGSCDMSSFRCENCQLCFVSVDKLDRHRLRCLPLEVGVLVRSDKAFSGYEGVVGRKQKKATHHTRLVNVASPILKTHPQNPF